MLVLPLDGEETKKRNVDISCSGGPEFQYSRLAVHLDHQSYEVIMATCCFV